MHAEDTSNIKEKWRGGGDIAPRLKDGTILKWCEAKYSQNFAFPVNSHWLHLVCSTIIQLAATNQPTNLMSQVQVVPGNPRHVLSSHLLAPRTPTH